MTVQRLHFDHALLPTGWGESVAVDVDGGRIAGVAANAGPAGRERVRGVALPGMANLHSHTFQRAMAGLAETRGPAGDNFWSWRQVMYRFLGALTADDVEVVAAFAFMEMLEGGYTSVGEFHYLHHDRDGTPYANLAEHCERLASASAATGIGLTLLPSLYRHGSFGSAPHTDGQKRFINDPERFLKLADGARRAIRDLPGANLGIAPHSLRAVDPESLAQVVAATPNGPVHIHAAEQVKEVEDSLVFSGRRPVEWLIANAGVDARWCLIHATHMTERETTELARSGAVAGLCPLTEASLGDGVFNAPEFVAANGSFGTGTDSNIEITAPGELKQLEYSQRLKLRARNVLPERQGDSTGLTLYAKAARGAAKALQRGSGTLAVGEAADIVTLDRSHVDLAHVTGDRWLDAYVFVAGKAAIDRVYANGKLLVDGGRHVARKAIASRYLAAMKRISDEG